MFYIPGALNNSTWKVDTLLCDRLQSNEIIKWRN